MTIEKISTRLLELLAQKAFIQALSELFDDQAVRTEPDFHPFPRTEGLQNLLNREEQFLGSIESWEAYHLSEPILSKDHFSIRMYTKLRMKSGQTLEADEIIVYQVRHGKITGETFFYSKL